MGYPGKFGDERGCDFDVFFFGDHGETLLDICDFQRLKSGASSEEEGHLNKRKPFTMNRLYERAKGREGAEPELGAARGERVDDARDIVADETEARHLRVVLHCPPQRVLRIRYRKVYAMSS